MVFALIALFMLLLFTGVTFPASMRLLGEKAFLPALLLLIAALNLPLFSLWQAGVSANFAESLWLSLLATFISYLIIVVFLARDIWPIAPILGGYGLLVGAVAAIIPFSGLVEQSTHLPAQGRFWIITHIIVALVAYGALTIAAAIASAAIVKERALRQKTAPSRFAASLPNLLACDRAITRSLQLAFIVITVGIATGMSVEFFENGALLIVNHKNILVFVTYFLVMGILAAIKWFGYSGRRLAQIILLSYVALTLAFPGVKFAIDLAGGVGG